MALDGEGVPIRVYVDSLLRERNRQHSQRQHYLERIAEQRQHFLERIADLLDKDLRDKLGVLNELRDRAATKDQLEAISLRVSDLKSSLDIIAGTTAGKGKSWALIVTIVTATAGLSIILGFVLAHLGVPP